MESVSTRTPHTRRKGAYPKNTLTLHSKDHFPHSFGILLIFIIMKQQSNLPSSILLGEIDKAKVIAEQSGVYTQESPQERGLQFQIWRLPGLSCKRQTKGKEKVRHPSLARA